MEWGGVGIEGVKHEVLSPRASYFPCHTDYFRCLPFISCLPFALLLALCNVVCPLQCCLPFAFLFALALCVRLALPTPSEGGRVLRSMECGRVGIEGGEAPVAEPPSQLFSMPLRKDYRHISISVTTCCILFRCSICSKNWNDKEQISMAPVCVCVCVCVCVFWALGVLGMFVVCVCVCVCV